jgi:hypothetical protein
MADLMKRVALGPLLCASIVSAQTADANEFGGREMRLTDVHGELVKAILA